MSDVYRTIILENAKVDMKEEDLRDEHKLVDDLQFDSISFVSMIVTLEGSYRISFDDDYIDPEKLKTVGDVAKYLQLKVGELKSGR